MAHEGTGRSDLRNFYGENDSTRGEVIASLCIRARGFHPNRTMANATHSKFHVRTKNNGRDDEGACYGSSGEFIANRLDLLRRERCKLRGKATFLRVNAIRRKGVGVANRYIVASKNRCQTFSSCFQYVHSYVRLSMCLRIPRLTGDVRALN